MRTYMLPFLLLLLASTKGFSQTDTVKMSLVQAIDHAIKNNPQLKAVQLDEEAIRYKIKEVKSSIFPQVNISGTGTDNFKLGQMILPGELVGQPGTTLPVTMGTRFVYGATAQLQQVIYNPSLGISIKAAKESQGLYAAQTFKSKEDLIYNMVSIYTQMQMTEKQQDLILGNLDRMKVLLRITNEQLKEGIAKKVDVDQLNVNNTNLETQLSNTDNTLSQLLNNLKLLMNMDVEQPLAITGVGGSTEKLDTSGELLLDFNTDLAILDKQIKLQDINTKNIKAQYLPTLSLAANFGRQYQSPELFKQSATNGFTQGYYSLNLSIPIFDGGTKRNKIAQSNISLQQLKLNREYTEQNIRSNYKTASNNLSQNQQVLKAQQQNMALAEELYKVAQLSFTEGISPLSELINAENSLREAQTQYLTAMLQMNLAELEKMKASGQLSKMIKAGNN